MYTDLGLRFAALETIPAAAESRLGGTSITGSATSAFAIDVASQNAQGLSISDLATSEMELSVHINTSFTSAADNATIEFRLVSIPIAPSLLSNATTSGKLLSIAGAVTTDVGDTVTIVGHNLPLGTPIFLTSIATTTGISNNVIYFVIPVTANTFQLAATLADALAGTEILMGGGNGTATVNFIPFVHATTTPIWRPFAVAGARYSGRSQPYFPGMTGKSLIPDGQTIPQPLGAGVANPPTGTTIPLGSVLVPGRYLCLNTVCPVAMTAGAYTVDLCVNAQAAERYHPSGRVTL